MVSYFRDDISLNIPPGISRAGISQTALKLNQKVNDPTMTFDPPSVEVTWLYPRIILSKSPHCKNSGVKLTPDWIQYRSNLEWCQFNTIAVLF